jgi:hypothetical protein
MYTAAAAAYGELARAGKLTPKVPAKVVDIRNRVGVPAPVFDTGRGKTGDEGLVDLTPKELAAVQRIAKDFGLKYDDAIKAYKTERKANPYYGR